jgi:hypothetical protein
MLDEKDNVGHVTWCSRPPSGASADRHFQDFAEALDKAAEFLGGWSKAKLLVVGSIARVCGAAWFEKKPNTEGLPLVDAPIGWLAAWPRVLVHFDSELGHQSLRLVGQDGKFVRITII